MTRPIRLAILVVLCWAGAACAAADNPPRAAIASAHPLATEAGYAVLKKGGNAFDAAVAVSAALGVVEPYSSGLGGGGFYLLHQGDSGRDIMVDGRETAPAAASHDMYLDAEGRLRTGRVRRGALSSGIPGTPAALGHLVEKYGKLSLAEDLAPAIRLARDGFKVDKRFAAITTGHVNLLKKYCDAPCPYLPNGEAPQAGQLLKQPGMADTLELMANQGMQTFYHGHLAATLVDAVKRAGGIWSLQDLADYKVVEREPIRGNYRGYHIVSAAPPSSGGITLLETLNILSGYDLQRADPATRVHLIVEAWRHAYRDRNEYLGDPDFIDMPVQRLLNPYYAAGLRATIRSDRALPSKDLPPVLKASPESMHTTHFSILDSEGNRVAATQTVNFRFGSGVVPGGTGVTLNNEMDDFAAKPGEPNGFGLVQGEANAVAPGKRPLSSMTPTFVEGPDGLAIIGTPGGSRIISMVTLALLDYVNGGSAKHMTAVPRFHHQYLPDRISYEPGAFNAKEIKQLEAMGYKLKPTSRRYGDMNVVVWNKKTGKVEAATDPRTEALVDF